MDTNYFATFFLSTGRCATQWLAEQLIRSHPDATVVHEAWQDHALTRRLLSGDDPAQIEGGEHLLAHAERIDAALLHGPYFETGFPLWTALPWLIRRFKGRIRIVHIPRHPVHTALSWVSHGAWLPPFIPGSPPGPVLLEAADTGVRHTQYQHSWATLTAYNKALFYWAEVQAAALDLENHAECPWLRLKFEDLFTDQGAQQLVTFAQVPERVFETEPREQKVDKWQSLIMVPVQWGDIANHSAVLNLSEKLKYNPMEVNTLALQQRFGAMLTA